jgi:hypothetical protein
MYTYSDDELVIEFELHPVEFDYEYGSIRGTHLKGEFEIEILEVYDNADGTILKDREDEARELVDDHVRYCLNRGYEIDESFHTAMQRINRWNRQKESA